MKSQERYRREAAEIEDEIDRTRAQLDDDLERLFDKLSPASLLDQAIGHATDAGFGLGDRVGHLFWRRPVPATLLSVGMSLFKSRGKVREVYRDVASRSSERLGRVTRSIRRRAHGLEDDMEDLTRRGGEKLRAGREKLREVGQNIRHRRDDQRAHEDEAGEDRNTERRDTNETRKSRKATLHQVAAKARSRARDYGTRAQLQADDYFERQPLLAGALLLLAGAAVAAVIPSSPQERKVLARPARRVRREASKTISRNLEKGTHAAAAAIASAGDAIESEGFAPEGRNSEDDRQEHSTVH